MTDIFGSSGNTISSLYDDDIDFNYDGVDSGIDVTQITNAFLVVMVGTQLQVILI